MPCVTRPWPSVRKAAAAGTRCSSRAQAPLPFPLAPLLAPLRTPKYPPDSHSQSNAFSLPSSFSLFVAVSLLSSLLPYSDAVIFTVISRMSVPLSLHSPPPPQAPNPPYSPSNTSQVPSCPPSPPLPPTAVIPPSPNNSVTSNLARKPESRIVSDANMT